MRAHVETDQQCRPRLELKRKEDADSAWLLEDSRGEFTQMKIKSCNITY